MTGPVREESTRIYLDFIDSQDERDVDVALPLVVVLPSGVIQLFDSLTREAVKWGVKAVLRVRRRKSGRQRQEIVFALFFVVAALAVAALLGELTLQKHRFCSSALRFHQMFSSGRHLFPLAPLLGGVGPFVFHLTQFRAVPY